MNLATVLAISFEDLRVQRERGQDLVEYALMLGLITLVCVGAISAFGEFARDWVFGLAAQILAAAASI
jgi:Flp pilus assembly pilin Flp